MDAALRLRLDLGLLLLAVVAGSTAVAAYGLTDTGAVLAGAGGLVVLTAVVLFLGTTPEWARGDADGSDGTEDAGRTGLRIRPAPRPRIGVRSVSNPRGPPR